MRQIDYLIREPGFRNVFRARTHLQAEELRARNRKERSQRRERNRTVAD